MSEDTETPKPAEVAGRLDGLVGHALGEAVAAIYFNDSSDYLCALWTIVHDLGGEDAVKLLETDEKTAYARYSAGRNKLSNAVLSGAATEVKPRRDV